MFAGESRALLAFRACEAMAWVIGVGGRGGMRMVPKLLTVGGPSGPVRS